MMGLFQMVTSLALVVKDLSSKCWSEDRTIEQGFEGCETDISSWLEINLPSDN